MQVVLTVSRAAYGYEWHPGDIIDVPDEEGRRLVAARSAEVPPPPAATAEARPAEVPVTSPRRKHARASD